MYRLPARLRAAFPTSEIESCASGGARINLGILELFGIAAIEGDLTRATDAELAAIRPTPLLNPEQAALFTVEAR